jgi:nitrogen fixation NifU-like protein
VSELTSEAATSEGIEALYREVVLDHYRKPRNREPLARPDASALVSNPVCGDQVAVEVRLEDGRIREVSSRARGCSIVVAAGSVMTELTQGLDEAAVGRLRARLERLVRGEADPSALRSLDRRIRSFARIAEVPARERCALLPWEALAQALSEAQTTFSRR